MHTVQGQSLVKAVIDETRQKITQGRKPEGNCTGWNQDLAIALRMKDIPAIPYGSPSYSIPLRSGGKLEGHCITVAHPQDEWIAVDLSSEQVQGLPPEKIWTSDSLSKLCDSVNADLPNFMRYQPGYEEQMLRAAERSKEKDLAQQRYKKFTPGEEERRI